MAGRSKSKPFGYCALLTLAWCSLGCSAAAIPSDPCNPQERPPQIGDGSMSISLPNKQFTRGWQRQSRNIEISVVSPKIVPKASIFVCFRWKLLDPNAPLDASQEKYKKFVATGIVTGSVPTDKPSGPLTITASVPTTLPEAPESPRQVTQTRPVGIYEQNNQYPLADVRVLLYADTTDPILDLTSTFGIIGADVYCDMPLTGTTADSGISQVSDFKRWQPVGGEFEFTVKATKVIPTNAPVLVCFRWKLERGDPRRFYNSGPTRLLDTQPQIIKIAATATEIPDRPSWWQFISKESDPRIGAYAIPYVDLIPLADARILVIDTDGNPIVDVTRTVGITNLIFAGIITVVVLVVAFYILYRVCKMRLVRPPKFQPLLCVITTRSGYASLSQFQIILWTFVVIASAAYVMALSGDLIAISSGTLVLLGISGTATVISKAKNEAQSSAAPAPLDPAAAAAEAETAEDYALKMQAAAKLATGPAKPEAEAAAKEARALADAAKAKADAAAAVVAATKKRAAVATASNPSQAEADAARAENDAQNLLNAAAVATADAEKATRRRHPKWSDLVMEETKGREIDVTRVQMLYFTLVTATFVLLKVITSYEIPVIPEGFLILMGISNSVYVGSKFAANPASK
jgi:hypothetical protein